MEPRGRERHRWVGSSERGSGSERVKRLTNFSAHFSHVTCHQTKSVNDLRGCTGAADFVTRKNFARPESLALPGLTKQAAARWAVPSSQPRWSCLNNSVIAA